MDDPIRFSEAYACSICVAMGCEMGGVLGVSYGPSSAHRNALGDGECTRFCGSLGTWLAWTA